MPLAAEAFGTTAMTSILGRLTVMHGAIAPEKTMLNDTAFCPIECETN